MSAFDGQLLEYPYVSVDRFNGINLRSSVYFLSHCHKDHIEGLLEPEFLERLKKGWPNVRLFTSETTKNLMLCDGEMASLIDFVVGLPIHQATSVSVKSDLVEDEDQLTVTLISAGHCVGSVMFLFEGRHGAVLFSGDFRLGEKEISKVKCFHSGAKIRPIKSMYVDTTFCCPAIPDLPTREETKKSLIEIIESWIEKGANHVVHLKCKGRYGYEYIMKEVAKHFKTQIHVNEWRMLMSSKLPDMLQYFTTNPTATQIHCCYFGRESTSSSYYLPCGLKERDGKSIKMITIIPSSLYFVKNGLPKDNKLYIPCQKLWRVVHSMHASYTEIRQVVGYIKPDNIYPFVPPVDCQDIWQAYQRLQDLQHPNHESQEKSNLETNTCAKKAVAEEKIHWAANLQNCELLSPKSAQRHHKMLSIDVRNDVLSPPPRRKRKQMNHCSDKSENEQVSAMKNDNVEKSDDIAQSDAAVKETKDGHQMDEKKMKWNAEEENSLASFENSYGSSLDVLLNCSWFSDALEVNEDGTNDLMKATDQFKSSPQSASSLHRHHSNEEAELNSSGGDSCVEVPTNPKVCEVIDLVSDEDINDKEADSDSDRTLSYCESSEGSQVF